MNIRVAIADDSSAYRQALLQGLSRQPGFELALACEDGASLLLALKNQPPHALPGLVLLDYAMPGLDGLATARALLQQHPGLRLLMLSAHDDLPFVQAAEAAGCLGHCSKFAGWPELLHAMAEVAAGRRCFGSPPPGP